MIMITCHNCGKEFDNEKYYGICPKCSTYNKEDQKEEFDNQCQQSIPNEVLQSDAHMSEPERDKQKLQRTPDVSIAVFICIVIGIVAGIGFPIGYNINKSIEVTEFKQDSLLGGKKADDDTDAYYGDVTRVPQKPEIITVNPNEAFRLGEEKPSIVAVEEAYIVASANSIPGFPVEENLVAIKINYKNEVENNYEIYNYSASNKPYVGYNGMFKSCLSEYDLEEYLDYLPEMNILDISEISRDTNGDGVFLVLLPIEVSDIEFYMDSRSEQTNDIKKIYSVPLKLNVGEEL